ncbi:hypothetical protein ACROYT_G020849, partial [Oculina patagonica]
SDDHLPRHQRGQLILPAASAFSLRLRETRPCDKESNETACQVNNVLSMSWGSRNGAVVRALASHQCGPGSIPARYHMWVEFVVGSRPCSEGFSPGSPVFLPSQKPTLLNSNSIGNPRATGLSVEDCYVQPS